VSGFQAELRIRAIEIPENNCDHLHAKTYVKSSIECKKEPWQVHEN
jgi:hypothetical protein